jgi:hypothetical protein
MLGRLALQNVGQRDRQQGIEPAGQQAVQLCIPERPGLVAEVRAAVDAGEQASAPPARRLTGRSFVRARSYVCSNFLWGCGGLTGGVTRSAAPTGTSGGRG